MNSENPVLAVQLTLGTKQGAQERGKRESAELAGRTDSIVEFAPLKHGCQAVRLLGEGREGCSVTGEVINERWTALIHYRPICELLNKNRKREINKRVQSHEIPAESEAMIFQCGTERRLSVDSVRLLLVFR
ncbi:hypothetical protein AVEN_157735-1 [Araneus ventricosus]|uniref:Uncharacterized protein n=1 Tax=Araneus ventricosus TaxID=182803 RepID=A0A4Y2HB80_ARAVE|nr:hypothetical protein AVEN_157734-1 [Araneus ventricosus]GBM62543.1 hypothetical protein AVEN_157735-1 [Araneus ventricosus]